MTDYIKPIGTEQFCNSTANSVSNSRFVRLLNSNTTTPFLITRANTSGAIGTFTIGAGQTLVAEKYFTETLAANTATNVIFAAPVAKKD
jgi:hypothetical protein